MKSFKEFLTEQAVWKDSLILRGSGLKILDLDIEREGLYDNYKQIAKYKNYNFGCLYIQSKGSYYKIYNFNIDNVIKAYLQLKVMSLEFRGKPILEVNLAQKGDIKDKGLVRVIYDFILDENIILSDSSQTKDSAKIWVELSRKYKVFLFDLSKNKIIEELNDLILKDTRVWNNNPDIRMICVK